ncbi:MAG: hypothetical protein JNK45_13605 [Myxococcales bacterium]|nr:hypothetical protein [Myxococcales bacterium]
MKRMQRWMGTGLGLALATGCVADSEEIGATVSDGTTTTGGSESTASGESESSGVSAGETTAQGETTSQGESTSPGETTAQGETTSQGESTTGQLDSCDEADNANECNGIDNEFLTCGWVETVVVASGNGCEPVETGFEGECVLTAQADTCTGAEFSTCPDGETRVYFAELGLEIGAIELVAFDSSFECEESAMGFEPCVMIAGDPVTWDPPECGCLCPG